MGAMLEKPEEVSRIRVQIDFSPENYAELTELQDSIGAMSRADTVRFALRTLQWLASELSDGAAIIVDKSGKQQRVVFPFLQNRKSNALHELASNMPTVSSGTQYRSTASPISRDAHNPSHPRI